MYYIQNFRREFKEGLKPKKKRKEMRNFPPEGFCITFRIPEEFKEGLRPKRKEKKWVEFKSTGRILYYIQNFKRIHRRFESQKEKKRNEKNFNPPEGFCRIFRIWKWEFNEDLKAKKEKKWGEFKSNWRIMYYIQNPKMGIQRRFESQKEKKRNAKNLNLPEGFCITFRIPEGNSKKVWTPKRKEKKWEEFKSTRRILYYIQNSRREFKEDLKAKKKRKEMRRI